MADSFCASLGGELRRAAAEVPDRPFIRMAAGEWTYREVDEESDRLAAGLHAQGVRPGDRVTLMLPNCIELALLWFALAKLGAVAAPVNTMFRGAALASAVNLVESRLAIVHATLHAPWAQVQGELETARCVFVLGSDGLLLPDGCAH